MFAQSPFVGPGTGGFMTHTLEILVMLGVALLLGALLIGKLCIVLHSLLNRHYSRFSTCWGLHFIAETLLLLQVAPNNHSHVCRS